jgi:hypothetical protein
MRKIGLIIRLDSARRACAGCRSGHHRLVQSPVASVTIFYRSQSSYEWLRTSDHRGSKSVLDGGACTTCHRGRDKGARRQDHQGRPARTKPLRQGGVYNVGFAVQDDNITARAHHVSFVKTLGFGAKHDFEAVKLP